MSKCEWVSVDQLSVVGAESEATLIVILFKEVLLHLMNPIDGMGLEPEQLGQVFSAAAGPAAALAFEVPVDARFDVSFQLSRCQSAQEQHSYRATRAAGCRLAEANAPLG
jgi:hypothetical protein